MTTRTLLLVATCSAIAALADVVSVGRIRDGHPLVLPCARQFTSGNGSFALPETLPVNQLDGLLLTPLAETYHQTVPGGTVMRASDAQAICHFKLVDDGVPESPEGYVLTIAEQGVTIESRDIRGLFYGMQTLCWLLRNRETPRELECCTITDWPDLAVRGFYLQLHSVPPSKVNRLCHVIDVLGSLKYNTLLINFYDNFPYSGLPFTGRKTPPLDRASVEAILEAARRNHMEVIPALQLISHTQWMKNHRDWPSLREGDNDFGYCLSNPAVQPIVEQLVRDTIDLVQPRHFHLGLDEIELGGLPCCPECKAASMEELMLSHLRPILSMLEERSITPIIYQDEFFGPSGPVARRGLGIQDIPEKLGRDIVVNSWEYRDFPSTALGNAIRERGFDKLLYMSFAVSIDNCQNLPKTAAKMGAMGNILSYWSMIPATLDASSRPLANFFPSIIAQANYCWNASDVEFSRIPIDSAQLLRDLLDGQPEDAFRGTASPLPLDGALNRVFSGDAVFPEFNSEITGQMQRLAADDPARFALKTHDGAPLAIVLSGCPYDGFASAPVALPVGTRATGASFLMTAAAFNTYMQANLYYRLKVTDSIGSLTIVYADGETQKIPLNYRRNINDWNTYLGGNGCRAVLRGNDGNGALFSLYAIDWRNPRPDAEIKEIVLSSAADSFVSPVLFAVSLADASQAPLGAAGPVSIHAPAPRPEVRQDVAVDFKDGLPQSTKASGAGTLGFDCRMADDPERGPVVNISMQSSPENLARALVDLPLAAPRPFESVVFDLKVSESHAIMRPDFYVMDRKAEHCLSALSFYDDTDDEWHTVCIPRQCFTKDGGGIDPEKAEVMSLRFFMHQWAGPVEVQLGKISYCDGVLPTRLNSAHSVR